jgi:hypothetical protein
MITSFSITPCLARPLPAPPTTSPISIITIIIERFSSRYVVYYIWMETIDILEKKKSSKRRIALYSTYTRKKKKEKHENK